MGTLPPSHRPSKKASDADLLGCLTPTGAPTPRRRAFDTAGCWSRDRCPARSAAEYGPAAAAPQALVPGQLRCIAGSTVLRIVETADYRPRWRSSALLRLRIS